MSEPDGFKAMLERAVRAEVETYITDYIAALRGPVEGEPLKPPSPSRLLAGLPYYGGGFVTDFRAGVFLALGTTTTWRLLWPATRKLISDAQKDGDRDDERLRKIAKSLAKFRDSRTYGSAHVTCVAGVVERIEVYLADDGDPAATLALLRRAHDAVALSRSAALETLLHYQRIEDLGLGNSMCRPPIRRRRTRSGSTSWSGC